jgi:hypothetical protein
LAHDLNPPTDLVAAEVAKVGGNKTNGQATNEAAAEPFFEILF